ncbi:MAG: HU family DNA-binding protein [Elusimicrobia bacterium]|jgi:nucleoid DNA-binding protein|nr:HU family DNA-binding protein [Elusimicrobiota bacterium]
MNKFELIQRVAKDAGVTRAQAIKSVKSLVSAIRDTIRSGDKISLTGLGTFKVKARKARPGRNPKTGETIAIPAGRKISFKPSLSLKKLVKG